MKVKSESEVAQSCPTLSDPMDRSLPDSSIHGILQARVLEWGAIAFSSLSFCLVNLKCLQLTLHTNSDVPNGSPHGKRGPTAAEWSQDLDPSTLTTSLFALSPVFSTLNI